MTRPADLSPADQPARAAAYGLLASAMVALLPHVPRWPWWLTVFVLLLFGWRLFMLRRGWPVPGRLVRLALTVLLAVLVFRHYGTLFGRDAGSSLLAAMLALKFLELRRLRDYMVGVFLVYFLIVLGFLYSQQVWLVLYLLAVFVATTATLVRLALPNVSGRRATRLALVLLAQALPLMLALYLLFPRLPGSLWGLPHDAHGALTGMSDEMRPGTINELSLSEEVAFRAHFPGELPRLPELYWRTLVLTSTDGRTWTRSVDFNPPARLSGQAPLLTYSVTVEPSNKPWLPALELPVSAPEGTRLLSTYSIEAQRPIRELTLYELSARPRASVTALGNWERRAALSQPPPTARVQALADSLRHGRSESETVRAALAYFNEQAFHYTLVPPLLGDDPVDEFLFETRRGFCEHYAAAFVSLMRAAGIPARVVIGYQGGEFNPGGRYFIVRQSDAHAWAEVYLPGQGWTRSDPTAAIAPERIEYGAETLRRLLARGARLGRLESVDLDLGWLASAGRDARLAFDRVQNAWQQWVLGYNVARQRQFLASLSLDGLDGARLIGVLALLVAAIMAVYLLATRPRAPRLDSAQRLYLRFCRKLARIGLARAAHEGPRDFADRCVRQRPDLAVPVRDITDLYLQLRYGAGPAPAMNSLGERVMHFRPRRRAPADPISRYKTN